MSETFDLHSPFLAICADRRTEGSTAFDETNSVYLVNPTGEPLHDVRTSTGGHLTSGNGPLVAEETTAFHDTVPSLSFVRIETASDDEFDEVACWWKVTFRMAARTTTLQFSTEAHLWNTRYSANLPILGRPGRLIPRSSA